MALSQISRMGNDKARTYFKRKVSEGKIKESGACLPQTTDGQYRLDDAETQNNVQNYLTFLIADLPPRGQNAKTKISRGFSKSKSPENSFGKTESAFRPATLPEYLEGRTPKRKTPFPFSEKNRARTKSEKQGVFFFRELPRFCEAVAGRFVERTILVKATTRSARAIHYRF